METTIAWDEPHDKMGNSYQLLYNCPLAWRMASQPDYLGQTQNKGINHAIKGPDFTPCIMVINNLIWEIKIKKPDTSQQGDDQIKTNKQQKKYFSQS